MFERDIPAAEAVNIINGFGNVSAQVGVKGSMSPQYKEERSSRRRRRPVHDGEALTFARSMASSFAGKGLKTLIFIRPAFTPFSRSSSITTFAVPAAEADYDYARLLRHPFYIFRKDHTRGRIFALKSLATSRIMGVACLMASASCQRCSK